MPERPRRPASPAKAVGGIVDRQVGLALHRWQEVAARRRRIGAQSGKSDRKVEVGPIGAQVELGAVHGDQRFALSRIGSQIGTQIFSLDRLRGRAWALPGAHWLAGSVQFHVDGIDAGKLHQRRPVELCHDSLRRIDLRGGPQLPGAEADAGARVLVKHGSGRKRRYGTGKPRISVFSQLARRPSLLSAATVPVTSAWTRSAT